MHDKKIIEFEGLRGLLAGWVVFGHILLFSGYSYQDGWFGIVFSPILGVYTFMMLSGFVIANALNERQEGWAQFMIRRFFRLFPVYLVCLLLALICLPISYAVAHSIESSPFGAGNLERLNDVSAKWKDYLLFDLTLLQCLAPKWIFANAHESFLPPTWSLSIEWLFYCFAPMLVWQIRRNAKLAAVLTVVLAAFVWFWGREFRQMNPSFHVGNLIHFLTGIGSFYLWKHMPFYRGRRQWLAIAVFWTLALSLIVVLKVPFKIWIVAMVILLHGRVHSRRMAFIEFYRFLMTSAPARFFGRISYATYLVHWIAIEVCMFWLLRLEMVHGDKLWLAISVIATVFPVTYFVSEILHRCVEQPGIDYGRRIVMRWMASFPSRTKATCNARRTH